MVLKIKYKDIVKKLSGKTLYTTFPQDLITKLGLEKGDAIEIDVVKLRKNNGGK